jgi:hypothetical protein
VKYYYGSEFAEIKKKQDTPQNDVSFTVMLFLRNFRLLLKLSANLFLVKL